MTFFQRVKKKHFTNQNIKHGKLQQGFTLIDLLIAMAIISILALSIRPSYSQIIIKSKEAALKKNLFLMREAIDSYYSDHVDSNNQHYYPKKLSDLTTEKFKYLRFIPEDPFTEKNDWVLIFNSDDNSSKGIFDIKSNSNLLGTNGKKYSEW